MVGDAFRVHALCDADYFFRHCQRLFLDHLKIAYHIDRGLRGNEGELVELLILKKLVGNLDDALFPLRAA